MQCYLHSAARPELMCCLMDTDMMFSLFCALSFSCNSPAFDRVVIFEAVKRDGRRESDKEGALRGRGFKDQDERNQKAGENQVQHVGWK